MSKPHDFWSSPTGFTLATIGAAVGLGSIWKFPYFMPLRHFISEHPPS